MKRLLKNIYCGISGDLKEDGSGYDFRIDFDENSVEDVVQFIEPYFTQSSLGENVYWFGYRFNGRVDRNKRDAFIKYLKEVQEEPEINEDNEYDDVIYSPDSISEYDLNEMIVRSLTGINLNAKNVDTIIYPDSSSSDLVRIIIKCMRRYLRNADRLQFIEVVKADPANIKLDVAALEKDIAAGDVTLPYGVTIDTIERDIKSVKQQDTFSLRRDIHPTPVRRYISNFLEFKKATDSLADSRNVLIVDDFMTTGTTVKEIIRIVSQYNPDCKIFIFTLIGSKRVH